VKRLRIHQEHCYSLPTHSTSFPTKLKSSTTHNHPVNLTFMSLLVMSTATESHPSNDRLSPAWIRRSVSWTRRKSAQDGDARPTTSNGFLSPRPSSSRTNSDESGSARSKSLDGRTSLRGVVNRLRSSSSASSLGGKINDNDIHDWFQGFRRYNQLVTTQFSPAPSYDAQGLIKATKPLTKNCGGQLIHGLPEAAFDFGLLWCPVGELSRRDTNEPSWSWTAFNGPVTFPFDPTTCPDLYHAPRSEGELFRSEITNFHIGPVDAQYTIRREKGTALRSAYPPYFHAPRGSDSKADSNTLRFTASTISAEGFNNLDRSVNNSPEQMHYTERKEGQEITHEIPICELINPSGQHCGVIMDRHVNFSEPHTKGAFEFVLISRNLRNKPTRENAKAANPTFHPPGTPIWHDDKFLFDQVVHDFDDDVFEDGDWKMLNVMLIKWHGDEYAERVAIARIHEDAWNAQGPARQDIVLR
jgi:hypothetical protein